MNFLSFRKKDIILIALFYLINFGLWELIAPIVSDSWASFLVYLLLFIVVLILFKKELIVELQKFLQAKLRDKNYYMSLLFWLGLNLIIGSILVLIVTKWNLNILPENSENVKEQISAIPTFLAVIQGCIFTPIIEEMTFRYAMIKESKNVYLYILSIVVSIVLFDWIHIVRAPEFFYYLVPATVLTMFYVKNKNVWASIMLHSLINICLLYTSRCV